jgi:hypothetical protein
MGHPSLLHATYASGSGPRQQHEIGVSGAYSACVTFETRQSLQTPSSVDFKDGHAQITEELQGTFWIQ